ncbi:hypothetical protein M9Y10_019755 [Tritrichomonas musculus]|uniref:G domain-containing protein n=1 Tax=Tritrichomonas musculus TaxID=1915356 RepID=A0ABR2HJB2_9EUKA
MDSNDVNEIMKKVSKMEKELQQIISGKENIAKVLIIGNTGSGKSSLMSCLSKKETLIKEGLGKKIVLTGQGIQSGSRSVTRESNLSCNDELEVVYCDCPGWEDTENHIQEIINSFIIDSLLSNSNHNKIKILFVISASEFDAFRARGIAKSIDRINKMFPDVEELKKGIGLVISKSDPNISKNDYLELLEDNASNGMLQWHNYFVSNIDHVFMFPQAKKEDIGKNYNFEDQEKIENFLKNDFIIDPIHKINLNEDAFFYLKNIQLKIFQKDKEAIRNIFILIREFYRNERNSLNLRKWLDTMNQLKIITKSSEFKKFIQTNFSNVNFSNNFDILNENEIMNSFIDKVFETNQSQIDIRNAIEKFSIETIQFVEECIRQAEIIEEQERIRIENERQNEERRRRFEEEQRKQREELEAQIQQQKILEEKKRQEIEELERRKNKIYFWHPFWWIFR